MPTTKIDSSGVTFPDASVQIIASRGDYAAGAILGLNSAGEVSTMENAYTKVKTIRVGRPGTVTIVFDLKRAVGATAYGQIYRSAPDVAAAAVGTERSTSSPTYETQPTENIAVMPGDTIMLYLKASAGATAYAQNFKITLAVADTASFRDET